MRQMKNFIVEHSIIHGLYLNKKLQYVKIENAHIWADEKEFYEMVDSPVGMCKTTIRQKLYKFKIMNKNE